MPDVGRKGTTKLRKLSYIGTLAVPQIEAVLGGLRFTQTLKRLNLESANMMGVEEETLERALSVEATHSSALRWLNLSRAKMSTQQVQKLLNGLTMDTTLQELQLSEINLSNVSQEAILKMLQLESVGLENTHLTKNQLEKLMDGMSQLPKPMLEKLNIHDNDLSLISAKKMAKALSILKTVDIGWTKIGHAQLKALFKEWDSNARLEEINLQNCNVRKINGNILAKVLSRCERVNLVDVKITGDQVKLLLQMQSTRMCPATIQMRKGDNVKWQAACRGPIYGRRKGV